MAGRWLKSVNTLLEKLDDGAETAATAVNELQQQHRRRRSDGDYEDYEDYEDYGGGEDDEYEDYEDDDGDDYEDESDEEGDEPRSGGDGGDDDAGTGHSFDESGVSGDDDGDGDDDEEEAGGARSGEEEGGGDEGSEPLLSSGNEGGEEGGRSDVVEVPGSGRGRDGPAFPPSATPAARTAPSLPPGAAEGQSPGEPRAAAKGAPPSPPRGPPPPPESPLDQKGLGSVPPAKQSQSPSRPPPPPPPPPQPVPPPPSSDVASVSSSTATGVSSSKPGAAAAASSSSSGAAAAATRQEKKLIKDLRRTIEKLERANAGLRQKDERMQKEMDAQQLELLQAATDMQEERQEHKDELRELREHHQQQLGQVQQEFQVKLDDLQAELHSEREKRAEEGGTMEEELHSLTAQQQEALKQSQATQEENVQLHNKISSLQSQVHTLQVALESAREAEAKAERSWENARAQHQQERVSRQGREAELERQVRELTALVSDLQGKVSSSVHSNGGGGGDGDDGERHDYKNQYEVTLGELEAVQTQLSLSTQHGQTLQDQLSQVLKERDQQVSEYEARQRDSDGKLSEMSLKVQQLESSLRKLQDSSFPGHDAPPSEDDGGGSGDPDSRLRHALHQLKQAREQVQSLSDQLLRQQGLVESTKTENIALRGRLQTATQRADAAEVALASSQNASASLDVEGGGSFYTGSKTRRRKGGRGALASLSSGGASSGHLGSSASSKSIRAALGWRALLDVRKGTPMEHVAATVDAVDQWTMEMTTILRYEPLARAAFAVYLTLVHLWCFALVCFHAVEAEHGDLGTLTKNAAHHPAAVALDPSKAAAAAAGAGGS